MDNAKSKNSESGRKDYSIIKKKRLQGKEVLLEIEREFHDKTTNLSGSYNNYKFVPTNRA